MVKNYGNVCTNKNPKKNEIERGGLITKCMTKIFIHERKNIYV